MKVLLYLFYSFFTINLFGQDQKYYELTKDSDTLYYFKYERPIIKKLGLISPDENKNFFRFSSFKYYLELSDTSNKYVMYVNEVWEGKRTNGIFIKQFDLTKKQVAEIKELVDSIKLYKIPSDDYIEKWGSGFDGITYKFELKDGTKYSFKHYWSPASQERFQESIRINQFIDRIDEIINYKENSEKFRNEIPFFSWTMDGVPWTAIRPRTKENYSEYHKYKRMKRKQLRKNK